jgi:hypothetical protein
MTKNEILLRKRLVNFDNAWQNNLAETMSLQRELMTYGYMLSQEAFDMIKHADIADIISFHKDVVKLLKEFNGGKYKSLYGDFPNDVMNMSDCEYYYNQIMHYWGKKTFNIPKTNREKSDPCFNKESYHEIKPCTKDEFLNIFTELVSVNNSLTPADQEIIKFFVKNKYELRFPSTIPFKENLAVLVSLCPTFTVKTVTDVLRVACVFSGITGGAELHPVPKVERYRNLGQYKFKLTTAQKERILELLENSNLDVREMKQGSKYQRWIRLFEVLHIEYYKKEYPKSFDASDRLRNQKRKGKPDGKPLIRTWYSDVERLFKTDFNSGLVKLSERPGEFVRRIDYLVRTHPKNINDIFNALASKGELVSTKVLFEVLTHFTKRNQDVPRSVFVKNSRKKFELPTLKALKTDTINTVKETIYSLLETKFSKLDPIGPCYVDEELKKIPLPENMRTMSDSLIPIIRGQKTKLNIDKSTLRAFVHWNDLNGNEDIDLHGYALGTSGVSHCGFNGVRLTKVFTYSGDVRFRRGRCAEYIDINIEEALKAGVEKVLLITHNFTRRPFSTLKDCKTGYIDLDKRKKSSTWLPDSVRQSVKLSGAASYCLIGVYDLKNMEYVHCDLDLDSNDLMKISAGNINFIKTMIGDPPISVYDLVRLHVIARGTLVSKDVAENYFTYDDFSKSYEKVLLLLKD